MQELAREAEEANMIKATSEREIQEKPKDTKVTKMKKSQIKVKNSSSVRQSIGKFIFFIKRFNYIILEYKLYKISDFIS